ncbi:MAG TPA: hypothetical protein VII49_05990 [Rhizomicrobium sp.]
MRRRSRIAIVFFAVLLVGAVAIALRALDAMGVFTDVAPVACLQPEPIPGIAGVQDLRYDAPSNALFIAATDLRPWPAHPSPADGLYVSRPGALAPAVRLSGTAADFHPFGIALFRGTDGSLTLMAINRPAHGKPVVDIFAVSDPAIAKIALHESEAVAGDLLVSPAGIAAVDKGRFYATNGHTGKTGLWAALENALLLPRADIVYFDGSDFRIAAGDLRFAAGIGESADGTHLYVAETTGRDIRTYARNIFSGDLELAGRLPVPSGVGNLDASEAGALFVAGRAKLPDLFGDRANPTASSPSEVFRVALDAQGIPRSAKLVWSATDTGAVTAGVPLRNRLLIASGYHSKILSCALRQ